MVRQPFKHHAVVNCARFNFPPRLQIACVAEDLFLPQLLTELIQELSLSSKLKVGKSLNNETGNFVWNSDVIVMDPSSERKSTIANIRRLRKVQPGLRQVMVTRECNEQTVVDSFVAGATGFLKVPVTAEAFKQCICQVIQGKYSFCSESQQVLFTWFYTVTSRAQGSTLTDREFEVMSCLLRGLRDKEIANTLSISKGTVHVHLSKIYKKSGTHNRLEAVRSLLGKKQEQACAE